MVGYNVETIPVAGSYAGSNSMRNGLLAIIAILIVAAGLRQSYSVSMPLAVSLLCGNMADQEAARSVASFKP